MYFSPKDFIREQGQLTFDRYSHTEQSLAELGRVITKFRKEIRDMAVEADQ